MRYLTPGRLCGVVAAAAGADDTETLAVGAAAADAETEAVAVDAFDADADSRKPSLYSSFLA